MASGDLLAVFNPSGTYHRYSGASWDSGISGPGNNTQWGGIAVDPTNGDVLIVGRITLRIYRRAGATWDSGLAVPAGEMEPNGLAVNSSGSIILGGDSPGESFYTYSGSSWDSGVALPTGVRGPTGLTLDSNENVVIVDRQTDRVYTYSSGSWDSGIALSSAIGSPEGIALNPSNNRIQVLDSADRQIYEYDGTSWAAFLATPTGVANPRGISYDLYNADVAPSFADNTGDAQTWTAGTAITPITVPEADGTPAPTYAAAGLPAGVNFNDTTRVISGTPTAAGSGTITVTATNSEGDADWTVDYTTAAGATAPARPSAPTLVVDSDTQITATGVAPDDGGSAITSYDWRHRVAGSGGSGWVDRTNVTNLEQSFSGLDASTEYDFRFRATNDVGDSGYSFVVRETTDDPPSTDEAPSWTDDTGDDVAWTVGTAITAITVPPVDVGTPTPTYASSGRPPGISFSTASRIISGTPTGTGSGTITITATNSEGSDTWTVDYVTSAALVAPSFADDTGDDQDLDCRDSHHVDHGSRCQTATQHPPTPRRVSLPESTSTR